MSRLGKGHCCCETSKTSTDNDDVERWHDESGLGQILIERRRLELRGEGNVVDMLLCWWCCLLH